MTAKALLAALTAAALATPAVGEPDLTGTWERYPQPGDTPDPALVSPPIPDPPLKPEYKAPWEANQAKLAARIAEGQPAGDNYVHCLPDGMPAMMQGMFPMEIFQRPEQINVTQEAFNQTRRIYLGETLPDASELDPTFYGHSVARWDGDTLVIETTNLNGEAWLNLGGDVMSDAMHITERYKMLNATTMSFEAMIDDPKVYTRPWTMVSALTRNKEQGFEIWEQACHEGNRSVQGQLELGMKPFSGVTPPR